jgi:hypothetical protein
MLVRPLGQEVLLLMGSTDSRVGRGRRDIRCRENCKNRPSAGMIEQNGVAPELVDNRADILRLPPQFDAADEIGFVLAQASAAASRSEPAPTRQIRISLAFPGRAAASAGMDKNRSACQARARATGRVMA